MPPKGPGEVSRVIKPCVLCDLHNAPVASVQQLPGVFHTNIVNVLMGCLGGFQLECSDEMGGVQMAYLCQLLYGKISPEIFVDIGQHIAYFLTSVVVDDLGVLASQPNVFRNQFQNNRLYPQAAVDIPIVAQIGKFPE